MEALCELLQKEQLRIPLIVGGATTSTVHTAVKLAPRYDYGVIQGGDASRTAGIMKRLLSDRSSYLAQVKAEQEKIRGQYYHKQDRLLPYTEAQALAPVFAGKATGCLPVSGNTICWEKIWTCRT